MTTLTDNDLRELKDLIKSLDSKFNDMRVDMATLKEGQNNLNIRIDETKESINKRLDGVDKRLDSVETRLNTVTLGVFGVIGVLVTGLLTFVGKIIFFPTV